MAKFRIDSIAELARQMAFTPHEARALQLAAAEELLHTIQAAKAYPLDFVIYRITGYHPRKVDSNLLTGLALQHDLGLLIERLSETLNVPVAALHEPVMSIEEVTERFNVTSKTIQRWRRKGLPARRFIFADGKRRVGFLLSSVERFFATHRQQVSRGTNLSVVGENETQEIVRRAMRLVASGCCMSEVTRRIGRKLNRSPAAVLQILRKHDIENPQAAVLPQATPEISPECAAKVLRALKHGSALTTLARQNACSRATMYRVILDEQLARLSRRRIGFIDDELYHQPDAEQILTTMVSQEELAPAASKDADSRVPRDVPPYLLELYRTPLLTPSRERALFLKFNFHKFQFVSARRRLEPELARRRDLSALEAHLKRTTDVKNQIIRANLRLVVNIARRHLRPGLTLMELVSEGNLTLMRAVESFDVHKGYRFSTYATLALMKGFARSVPEMLASHRQAPTGIEQLAELADARSARNSDRILDREHVRDLLTRLDDRERMVIQAHYGLSDQATAMSDDELGMRLGVSRQRLRQIERTALEKLRATPNGEVPMAKSQ